MTTQSTYSHPELSKRIAAAKKSLKCEDNDCVEKALEAMGVSDDDESVDLLENDATVADFKLGLLGEDGTQSHPQPRIRKAWRMLSEGVEPKPTLPGGGEIQYLGGVVPRPIGQWKDVELLEAYSVDAESEVIDTLLERSRGRAFIVFEDETAGKVNAEVTGLLLRRVRRNLGSPETYRVGKELKRVYRAGDFPSIVQHECPFHPVFLFGDYCDTCKYEWADVDYEVMQFAAIVAECGDAPEKSKDIREFIAIARDEGLKGLSEDYPEAYMRFIDARKNDTLPNLKKRSSAGKVQDPINVSSSGKRSY